MANKDIGKAADILDLLLQEQLYSVMTPEIALHVKGHSPATAKEAATFAHTYCEAKSSVRNLQTSQPRHGGGNKNRHQSGSGQSGHRSPPRDPKSSKDARGPKPYCFKCKKEGHWTRECKVNKPNKPQVAASIDVGLTSNSDCKSTPTLCQDCEGQPFNPLVEVRLNGIPVRALRDTGADSLMVARHLVTDEDLTGRTVTVAMADPRLHFETVTAIVQLDSPFLRGRVEATVLEKAVQDVIIGNTVTFASGEVASVPVYAKRELVQAVQTRAQARSQGQLEPLPAATSGLEISPGELAKLQRDDPSLQRARRLALQQRELRSGNNRVKFLWSKEILKRLHTNQTGQHTQVCVPKSLRREVMRIAHDTPMSGHLAAKRTQERIWAEFYWPGMCGEIRRYCRSCDQCQKTEPRGRIAKVPLGHLPLVDVPFQRVGVDIVGPITPASDRGNRYLLVMVDYATRYPEAVPLKSIDTEHVAEALWNMWTRLGIPSEVLSDNGSQFTSEVMREVHRLLSIKGKTTTPYHAQCNGLVERFNATLKSMLRRLCQEKPRTWDRLVPAVLFAYREVPQESTGFSPFELLYGRTVRGPMAVQRQLWTGQVCDDDVKTSSTYVFELRNRIEETCRLARESLLEAGRRQKRQFDRKARFRSFKPGDQVLLLLPTKHNKLEMAWRGPFPVEERVGDHDYRIVVGNKSKLFHANLLKRYFVREESAAAAFVVEDSEEWEPVSTTKENLPVIPLEAEETVEDIHLDPEAPEMHADIKELAGCHQGVLTDLPLHTNLMTCEIRLESGKPVRTKQYPLPFSQRETIKEEVDAMLKMGVIEKSASPFSSPIVLVKKKDGKIRFCVDFRRLNRDVVFDAEPMPDMEYLFAKLGKAKYLSKLDLSKGYWQVPMRPEDKPKTAFTTPQGQYQWTVMPFGLKTAGAIFSRMMRLMLQPLNLQEVDNFMDDILIATDSKERHLQCLRLLFQRLEEVSLSARPSKCYLGFRRLEYLGHIVGQGSIQPEDSKMAKIRDTTQPTTKKQIRSFLGLVGFYRRFVPHFAEIALPLTEATKASKPNIVKWDDRCEQAFQTLKARLCSAPICCLPVVDLPFVLMTDASDTGLGAILLQDQGFGLQPIACASKKLVPAERNYATVEKELLAVVWGVQKFSPYLYGNTFVIQSDHQPLQYLHQKKTTNSRLMRWAMQLQPYSFTFQAIPGKENIGADFLSRLE